MKAKEFEFQSKGREINKIGKSRGGKAKEFEVEFKGQEINKIGKSRCGKAKEFEFESKGQEINKNWEIKVREGITINFVYCSHYPFCLLLENVGSQRFRLLMDIWFWFYYRPM